jgi:chemotaxis protein methyltransferase CheR
MNAELQYLRDFVRRRSGLSLSADKDYLIENRLQPLVRRNGLRDIAELVGKIERSPDLAQDVVDAMATSETSFFRDKIPFEILRDQVIPELLAARAATRTLRIWCAACASGQEPYSVAMLLREMGARLRDWKVSITATDMVARVVKQAEEGVYSQFEVQRGLPIQYLLKYFTRTGEAWKLVPEIRQMVNFRRLNLLDDISSLGQFDIVICRNVLIYFDLPVKVSLLERLTRALHPDGALLLGGTETTLGLSSAFAPHARAGIFLAHAHVGRKSPRPLLAAAIS